MREHARISLSPQVTNDLRCTADASRLVEITAHVQQRKFNARDFCETGFRLDLPQPFGTV